MKKSCRGVIFYINGRQVASRCVEKKYPFTRVHLFSPVGECTQKLFFRQLKTFIQYCVLLSSFKLLTKYHQLRGPGQFVELIDTKTISTSLRICYQFTDFIDGLNLFIQII